MSDLTHLVAHVPVPFRNKAGISQTTSYREDTINFVAPRIEYKSCANLIHFCLDLCLPQNPQYKEVDDEMGLSID